MFAKQSAKVHALFPKGQGRAVCIERGPTGRVIIVIVAEREEREDKREEKRREERRRERSTYKKKRESKKDREGGKRLRVCVQNASVCAVRTSPCVPGKRPHVQHIIFLELISSAKNISEIFLTYRNGFRIN